MNIILCHQTADFDTLGAAVGLASLLSDSRIVLAGGAHARVKDFLRLYRDHLPLIERKSVQASSIQQIFVVDTQLQARLGTTSNWLDLPGVNVTVIDHHLHAPSDIQASSRQVESVGAATTLVVEKLIKASVQPSIEQAIAMALGIHTDTGSLTYPQTTLRDAKALTWLLEQGAYPSVIAYFLQPRLGEQLQELLTEALNHLQTQVHAGYKIAWVGLESPEFVPDLSTVTEQLRELTASDALFLGHCYKRHGQFCLSLIGRSNIPQTNLAELLANYGGGGHPAAAAGTFPISHSTKMPGILHALTEKLLTQIPRSQTAQELMSAPVRTIAPTLSIAETRRLILRYGHAGFPVVDNDCLIGIISRRDLDLAEHHGFQDFPVKGFMSQNVKTVTPDTPLSVLQELMGTYDIGRLPVLANERLVGIVTRTDLIQALFPAALTDTEKHILAESSSLLPAVEKNLPSAIWSVLRLLATLAQEQGWHLYLVGGGVRDLLLTPPTQKLQLPDVDLVVDGGVKPAAVGAGVSLAQALQKHYPAAQVSVHGDFQTAAISWHHFAQTQQPLSIDIATARTEFYPYPAANPEVVPSSIRQDLYRRDFTVNALALRLSEPEAGLILDYFGGVQDLRQGWIRALHPNSFIEDPTRIFRAVRFAVRLGFSLETQTRFWIEGALKSGVYERSRHRNGRVPALESRLKAELKTILSAAHWMRSLNLLGELNALQCIHPQLKLTPQLHWQIRYLSRWLKRLTLDAPPWQLRLEFLINELDCLIASEVAQRLQLPKDALQRLPQLVVARRKGQCLTKGMMTSHLYGILQTQPPLVWVLVAPILNPWQRRQIWEYLTRWQPLPPLLTGAELKQLGYRPGPQFKVMLTALRFQQLDQHICDRPAAIEFIQQHFPLEN
ncbi:MAG: CBS domain-containing protein [Cyanobacteria bacterium P01_H01_bin.15]